MVLKHAFNWFLICFLMGQVPAWAQGGPKSPVVFVLAASETVRLTGQDGGTFSALPTQRLVFGQTLELPKGARVSLLVLKTGNRRVFHGPAQLKVIADTVRLVKGAAPKVSPVSQAELDMVQQWMSLYARPRIRPTLPAPNVSEESTFQVIEPIDQSLLLTRSPEFVFRGEPPREGNLMVFDARGKRFWVAPIEGEYLTFPPAANFNWGQSFTWEVRKLTGGRLLSGSFQIASEETARALLEARVADLPGVLPEAELLYGMRLHLAGAYVEARSVFARLGLQVDAQGQPRRVEGATMPQPAQPAQPVSANQPSSSSQRK
jgi:hypothetical protein